MIFSKPYRFSSIITISSLILSACALPAMASATPVVYVDEEAAEAVPYQNSKDPTEEPTEDAQITNADPLGNPRLTQDDLCLSGPGQDWSVQSSLTQGMEVHLVGVGLQPGWLVISHPDYPNFRCWVPEEHIDLPNPDILNDLPILPIPPKP